MPRVTYSGEPGEVFENTTGRVLYQFQCDWKNTCGLCAQMDGLVGPSFPIPLHRGCRCRQSAVWPGETSRPFTDFRDLLAALPDDQKAKVVGVANLKLIDSGTVKWEDVVTGQRVRDLQEVVAIKKLSRADLDAAGVDRSVAERAYQSVHTSASDLARQKRDEMIARLLAKGVEKEALKKALGERLASRVGIASGPSGPALPEPPPEPPPEGPTSPATGAKAKSKPKPKPPPVVVPVTVRERADYLKKAKVKPDVAERLAREEAAAKKAFAIPEIPERRRYVKEVVAEQDGKLKEIAAERGTTVAAILDDSRAKLQAALDKGEIYVRADSATLKKILAEGRFKSQFETNTSAGSLDHAGRKSAEAEQFGVATSTESAARPIYGYVSAPGFGSTYTRHEARLETYGDAVVKLKAGVRDRATVTVGDSLGKLGMGYASPVQAADPRSIPWGGLNAASTESDLRHAADPDEALRSLQLRHGYVEAQMNGGLSADDIEEVAFTYKPNPAYREALEAKGIKWRVIERQEDD